MKSMGSEKVPMLLLIMRAGIQAISVTAIFTQLLF